MHHTLIRIQLWLTETIRAAREDDRGAITTETAIITALLATAGVAVVGVIALKARGWADSIPVVGG
jgi:hypothetical protein